MSNLRNITIQLEFVPASPQNVNPADVDEVGRIIFNSLRNKGYDIQPMYTGERGGALYNIAVQIAQSIQNNKELLIALVGLAVPIVDHLLDKRRERLKEQRKQSQFQERSFEVHLTINDQSITILEVYTKNEQKLLEKLLGEYPNLSETVTPESKVKITTSVDAKPSRRRR